MNKINKELKKLLSGKDGELSVRRVLGAGTIIAGIVLTFLGKAPVDGTVWAGLWSLRGPVLIVLGLFLLGLVTAQNVGEWLGKKKDGDGGGV